MRYVRERTARVATRSSAKWLVTYADMMTLLLVFFLLMFAFSHIDDGKFQQLSQSLQRPFLPENASQGEPEKSGKESAADEQNRDENSPAAVEKPAQSKEEAEAQLQQVVAKTKAYLEEHELKHFIQVTEGKQGVVIVLQDKILFDTGQAALRSESEGFLSTVADLLATMSYEVRVEGHTDDRPISSFRYPSNWELSSARASAVIRYFIEKGRMDPERLSAVGYGEHRPVADNDTPEGRAKNRRVEIVIVNPFYDEKEPNNANTVGGNE